MSYQPFAAVQASQKVAAWIVWDNTPNVSFASVISSYGISNITRISDGTSEITFSPALPNADYCLVGSASYEGGQGQPSLGMDFTAIGSRTTTTCRVTLIRGGVEAANSDYVCAAFIVNA